MVGTDREVRQFQKTITGDKNETSNNIIAVHGNPDLIDGNVFRTPLGNRGQIGDAIRILGICRVDAGCQGGGIRRLSGADDQISGYQNVTSIGFVSGANTRNSILKGVEADFGGVAEGWKIEFEGLLAWIVAVAFRQHMPVRVVP